MNAAANNTAVPTAEKLEEMVNTFTHLDTDAMEQLMQRFGRVVAQRKAPALDLRESELLHEINHCIPVEWQREFEALSAKMKVGTSSADEQNHYQSLIDDLEEKYALRLRLLIELAQLRKVTLSTLMTQLGFSVSIENA
jgi:hypothetical protein